jgi:rfaE bifunctional protein kinase chain/domain
MSQATHHIDSEERGRLEGIMARFSSVCVLVVGDLVLDKYTVGKPVRISREAPIAVLEFTRDYSVPGGGTSPACTVASLGGRSYLTGVVGVDDAARDLLMELAVYGVDTGGVVADPSRPTIAKRRIVAQVTSTMYQQVARVDHIDRRPVNEGVEEALLASVEERMPLCDAVLLSNYQSGTLTPAVVEQARFLASKLGKISTVDSQGDLSRFHGFDIVKCNQPEAEEALRRPLRSDEEFEAGMAELLDRLEARAVIVTRSAEGMSVATREGGYAHIPVTNTSEVFDVTGAGDTVIALVTLGLAAGADLFDAARLANYGAGVVVRKWGNAVLKPEELRAALRE